MNETSAADYPRAVDEADRRARREVYWHERIHRFSVLERVLHWSLAVAGIICILTGLGWYAGSFQFLLAWFGGGETARWIHSVAGIVTTATAIALIGVLWYRRMFKFIPEDWQWLKVSGGYLRRHTRPAHGRRSKRPLPEMEQEVPPQGFFNGGQKLWGILAIVLAIVFLGSGLVIWSPELWPNLVGLQPVSVRLMRIMYVLHDVAFIIFAPMVLFHTYLSTILNPGTLEAMTKGDVTRLWALHHHPLWHREAVGEPEAGAD